MFYYYSIFHHTGSIPLSPLSYNTITSHTFNGTQPSNEGCTDGVIVNEQVTIDCGQGTTLMDCDRGYNDNADYSDLSHYFIWSMTASFAASVSIVFRFDQEVRGSKINMFFWNSQSNRITVPNVMIDWATHIMSFSPLTTITTNSLNRTEDGQCVLNIDINNAGLFQYLRIDMNFDSEWIFLSEVQFCGEYCMDVVVNGMAKLCSYIRTCSYMHGLNLLEFIAKTCSENFLI